MEARNRVVVIDRDGRRGSVDASSQALDGSRPAVLVDLADGRRVRALTSMLRRRDDSSYDLAASFDELPRAEAGESEEIVVPLVEEQLSVGRRTVDRGGVRITRRVQEREETVDVPRLEEDVEVRRVRVDRVVETPAEVRQEGDTLIVPLHEERLVLRKELVLREELHVTKRRAETSERRAVTLRSEEPEIEQIEPAQDERRREPVG